MFNSLLEGVLSPPDSPTADLYFRNACRDFLRHGVEQLAPTVFASDTACLVMRHHMRVRRLPQRRRLIYLVDDDVMAGTRDESLPFFYRQKLRWVEQAAGRWLTRFAGVAVVGSPTLARLFRPVMETHLLRPFWSERLAGLGHFDALTQGEGWIETAFLGSVVHRTDLNFLLPVVGQLLEEEPRFRFHVPERHSLPAWFERHPRVLRIPGLGWTEYRREIGRRQFHIACYPLLDTPFNRARSPNKLIEQAVVGAAPIYSAGWSEGYRVRHGQSGLCVPNSSEAWLDALRGLLLRPERARDLAEGAQALAKGLNDPAPQRALWRDLLGIAATRERREDMALA